MAAHERTLGIGLTETTETRIAILGSVGVPARYGGFETLAENLVRYHAETNRPEALSVYCSGPAYPDRPETHGRAKLRYSRWRANGASSILYDATTLRDAIGRGVDVALLLGVSGAVALPLIRRGDAKIVVHVDGLEWRGGKWSAPARAFLRWSERLAVRHADAVIADSPAIADHIKDEYGKDAHVIAYGGDQAVEPPEIAADLPPGLSAGYALALCRIEPENNVQMILAACEQADQPLVFIGNRQDSAFGRRLRARYEPNPNLHLLDPIYAPAPLYSLREAAACYIHGHSAGGTNPALVEMMHFGCPILAFDCIYNRLTTNGAAKFFDSAGGLATALHGDFPDTLGAKLREVAQDHYCWNDVSAQYFALLTSLAAKAR